jgi:hypothetical protein
VNGPEHYRQAERLLRNEPWLPPTPAEVARAQVHATLALAAATALTTDNYDDWCAATAATSPGRETS